MLYILDLHIKCYRKFFYNVHEYSMLNRYSKTTGSCLVHVLCTLDAVKGCCHARAEPPQLPSHLDGSDGQFVEGVGAGDHSAGSRCNEQ